MLAVGVVVTLGVGKEFGFGIGLIDEFSALEHFSFEGSDTGFRPGVVVRIGSRGHALARASIGEELPKPTAAISRLVAMPELGRLNRKQVASLAGLAPVNRDSDQMRGKRTIYGGRKSVRQAIYMAALSTKTHNPILRDYYANQVALGKPNKLALTAVMRKLLVHLNAQMKSHLKQQEEANRAALWIKN